ncbi:MAG TPA: MFS transporter [Stellaceae bacterium]|nr:MFS transporter [Stellaceae bacterium]
MDIGQDLRCAAPPFRRRRRLYFGWQVVAASFLVALFAWGFGLYGTGIYLAALRARTGWSVSLISAATTFYFLSGALFILAVPDLLRRLGARGTILVGAAAMALAVAAIAWVESPWQLFADYLLLSVGWATMTSTTITTIIAPWFLRRRGLAISIALNGASCGGVVVAPALALLTGRFGFARGASLMLAAMLLVLVPAVLLFLRFERPEQIGLRADGEPHSPNVAAARMAPQPAQAPARFEVLRSFRFWTIAAPFALVLLAQVGFLTHQFALVSPLLGRDGAGAAIAVTTIAAITGRLSLGLVVDRLDLRRVSAAVFACQIVALFGMEATMTSPAALYLGSALYGLCVGNVITLPPLLVQREFPASFFATVMALATAMGQVTYAFGPALLVRDGTGGYGAALLLCAALESIAAALVLIRAGRQ